jgi:hypothetical protein
MAFHQYLKNISLNADETECLVEAFGITLKSLGLTNRDDPITEVVVSKQDRRARSNSTFKTSIGNVRTRGRPTLQRLSRCVRPLSVADGIVIRAARL